MTLDPNTIGGQFFINTATLKQSQIDWLVKRHAVPILALVQDGDGTGWCIGAARVERVGQRFEFIENGAGAFVVIARDEDGIGRDLVAWEPREGWIASWLGALELLGQHELFEPRLGDPLRVHPDFLGWLRAGRNGIVILDGDRARHLLEGMTLVVDDVRHRSTIRRRLAPREVRIEVAA